MALKSRIIPLATLIVAIFAGGCDATRAPYGAKGDPLPAQNYPNIAFENKGLRDAVFIGSPVVEASTAAKPMRVTVPLRNTANKELNIQYRFEFLDAAGRPLQNNSGWAYQLLPMRIECTVDGGAMESEAVNWRLIVRSAL